MDKIDFERRILDLAKPVLQSTYGNFLIDESQTDRPDAAIDILKPKKYFGSKEKPVKVGVEITTVDYEKYKAYMGNDKKTDAEISRQLQNLLDGGEHERDPLKNMDVKIPQDYIYKAMKRKCEKYHDYVSGGDFKEVVLICASEVVSTNDPFFLDGLLQWTNYYLSEDQCPFDRVIFGSFRTEKSVEIFCKKRPMKDPPNPYQYEDSSVTAVKSSIIPTGKIFNIKNIFDQSPIIKQRKR